MSQEELQELILESIEEDEDCSTFDMLSEYADTYGTDIFFFLATTDTLLKYEMYSEVFLWIDKAQELFGPTSFFYERKGDAYYALQDYEKALEAYKSCDISDDDYDNLQVHHMIGACYLQLYEYTQAIPWFENVLLEEQRDDTQILCAMAYALSGKEERALDYLLQVSESMNTHWSHIVYDFLIEADLSDQFIDSYIEGNRHLDTHLIYMIYVRHYLNTNQAQKAVDKALEFHELIHNFESYGLLSAAYEQSGDDLTFKKLLRHIISLPTDPNDREFALALQLKSLDQLQYTDVTQKKYIMRYYTDNHDFFPCVGVLLSYSLDHELFSVIATILSQLETPSAQEDIEFLRYFKIQFYLTSQQYQKGYVFLRSLKDIEHDENYYKDLVVFSFYLNYYDKVLEYAPKAMPSGIVATMYHISALMLEDFDTADKIVELMMDDSLPNLIDDYAIFIDYLEDSNSFFSNDEEEL